MMCYDIGAFEHEKYAVDINIGPADPSELFLRQLRLKLIWNLTFEWSITMTMTGRLLCS